MPRSLLAAISAVAVVLLSVAGPAAHADEGTIGYDPLRTNWDPAEPRLGPDSVTAADFGTLWDVTLPRPAGQTVDYTGHPLQPGGQTLPAPD